MSLTLTRRSDRNRAMMASKAQIPQGWRQVRLGGVAEVDTGGTPNRSRPEYWDGQIPWMASGQINQRRVMTTVERITWEGLKNSNAKLFPSGTVMVAMNGQGATRGKACVLGIEASCNQSLAAICSRQQTENGFLFHVLDSAYHLLRSLTGDGRAGLNLELIRGFSFLLPLLPEQRAIAAVLDSIDDAIEGTEGVIAVTEQLRDSLLHQLLTHGIPSWHTEWKEAPGLGTIPAGWEVVRLGDRLEEGPTNGIYKPDTEYGSGVCLIRIDDFGFGEFGSFGNFQRIRAAEDEIRRYEVKEGDIVVNRVNSLSHIGKSVLIPKVNEPTLFESNMMRVRFDKTLDPRFGAMVLLSADTRRYFKARAKKAVQQASINQQDVSELPLPLPPFAEQQAIAAALDGVDVTIDEAKRERDGLQLLKESAADALLTGRVRLERERDE